MNRTNYNTIAEVEALITNTYLLAAVTAIVFIVISIIAAQLIAYEGSKNAKDSVKRRAWFFILAAIELVAFFSYNYFYVEGLIKPVPALQAPFFKHSAYATIVCVVAYLILGFILSKIMKHKKYGTIFPSKS